MGRYLFTSARQGLKPLSKSIEGLHKEQQYVSLYFSRLENGLVLVTNLVPNDKHFDPTFIMLCQDACIAYKKYTLQTRAQLDSQEHLMYCNRILSFIEHFKTTL